MSLKKRNKRINQVKLIPKQGARAPVKPFSFRSIDLSSTTAGFLCEPDRYRYLTTNRSRKIIPRGSGVSYVAASHGNGVISFSMKHFSRILNLNINKRTVTVETGITIGELQNVLFSHRLMLPVLPGHPQISVGGCIACNVHGKNSFKNKNFCDWVEEITLLMPDGKTILLKRKDRGFSLTCGGFGLTGLIISAKIRLQKLPLETMQRKVFPVEDLMDTQEQMRMLSRKWDYLLSWNDLSTSRSSGRGYILAGRFSKQDSSVTSNCKYLGLNPSRKKIRLPWINEFSIPIITKLYSLNLRITGNRDCHFWEYVFPQAHMGFYFDMYGQKGFLEHQVLVPHQKWKEYIFKFRALQKKFSVPIIITSLKLFSGRKNFLNFSGNVMGFTINIVNNKKSLAFLNKVDELDCKMQSIANIAKDSRIRSSIVKKQYPAYHNFRKELRSWSGSDIYESVLSRRLAI